MIRLIPWLFLLILSYPSVWAQNNNDTLPIFRIEPQSLHSYSNLMEMAARRMISGDFFTFIDTSNGYFTSSDYIGNKNGPVWTVGEIPHFNHAFNQLSTDSTITFPIDSIGKPELILYLSSQEYGARGGSDYTFIQIWDLDKMALLLNILTKEHFAWYSTSEDEGTCKRSVRFKKNQIIIGSAQCSGNTEGFHFVNDTNEIHYQLKKGQFIKTVLQE